MSLQKYFTEHTGTVVLETADQAGNVNTAIYARPQVHGDSTLKFIMRDRLSRKNILENGHASYLFYENGKPYKGLRLKLQLIGESADAELLQVPSRSDVTGGSTSEDKRFLVEFSIEKCFSLIGGQELEM